MSCLLLKLCLAKVNKTFNVYEQGEQMNELALFAGAGGGILGGVHLDGEPFVPSNGNLTQQAYCASDKMKDFSRLSQFGMTYKLLTENRGEELLKLYLEAFHVRIYPQQEKAQELKESEVECGNTWHESFAKYDHVTSSWKTPQCSLLEDLDEFSETWPKLGTMQNGVCSVLEMSEHHTNEIAFGLKRNWPTPTSHNAKEQDSPAESNRNTPSLCNQARGGDMTLPKTLNPVWVEWLMGWPQGWTDLKPLETDKFRQWQHLHGIS